MFEVSQTKNNKGQIPCKGIEFTEHPNASFNDESILFEPYTAIELRQQTQMAPEEENDDRYAGLNELASCMKRNKKGAYELDKDNIAKFAKEFGPLFGASTTESVRGWAYAINASLVAEIIQEFLNDPENKIGKLKAQHLIAKTRITSTESDAHFTWYSLQFAADEEYLFMFGTDPKNPDKTADIHMVRRISTPNDVYYIYINSIPTDGTRINIEISVLKFDDEISSADFHTLRELFNISYSDAIEIRKHLKLDDIELNEDSEASITAQTNIVFEDLELTPSDADPMRAMLQALVVVHLGNATLDVFQGESSTGFIVFDCCLAWLWFDFSQKLSTVRIGYCLECGRAFSLAGHRGLPRYYCSDSCKTAAKNKRLGDERNAMRASYRAGKTIEQIQKETGKSRDYIIEQIAKEPQFKHELDEDIEKYGFAKSPILMRCLQEHFGDRALRNALSTKRIKELEDYRKLLKKNS